LPTLIRPRAEAFSYAYPPDQHEYDSTKDKRDRVLSAVVAQATMNLYGTTCFDQIKALLPEKHQAFLNEAQKTIEENPDLANVLKAQPFNQSNPEAYNGLYFNHGPLGINEANSSKTPPLLPLHPHKTCIN
jgi:hypothetical protein